MWFHWWMLIYLHLLSYSVCFELKFLTKADSRSLARITDICSKKGICTQSSSRDGNAVKMYFQKLQKCFKITSVSGKRKDFQLVYLILLRSFSQNTGKNHLFLTLGCLFPVRLRDLNHVSLFQLVHKVLRTFPNGLILVETSRIIIEPEQNYFGSVMPDIQLESGKPVSQIMVKMS